MTGDGDGLAGRRAGAGVRSVVVLLCAAALLALAASIVLVFSIGPVVARLTWGHGVHAGDVLALIPALTAVWLVWRHLRSLRTPPAAHLHLRRPDVADRGPQR